jgi:TRAP transporter 4TM/12TM fusion protein
MLLLISGAVALGFVVIFQEQVTDYGLFATLDLKGAVFAFALMVVLLEGSRRASGSFILPSLLLLVFLMTIFNNYMPGVFHGLGFSFKEVGLVLYVGSHGFFGIPLRVATTIVIMFLIFSQILRVIEGSDWFIKLALCLVGSMRGGPAKAAVVASALFGSISGSPSSNAAGTGIITIPLMKKTGYSPEFAGAVEATASTGGQILPPVMGAVGFVIAEWLEITYVEVIFAVFVPACLYFAVLFYGVDIEARKKNLRGLPRQEITPLPKVIKEGWFYLLPLATLIYFLVFAQYPAEISALYAILAMFVLGIFVDTDRKRLSLPSFQDAGLRLRKLVSSIGDGVQLWVRVAIICGAVGILVGCFTQSGVGLKTAVFIIKVSGEHLILVLVFAAIAAYILGMGLDTLPLYITLAILVAPALVELGVSPIHAHLFVLFWGLTSFITPPLCLAVYITSAIAEGGVWRTGLQAMRLGIVLFIIPFAFIYYPGLLMRGSFEEILLALAMTLLATVGIVGGMTGFLGKEANWVQRILLMAGGVMVMIPGWKNAIPGILMIFTVGLWQWSTRKEMFSKSP